MRHLIFSSILLAACVPVAAGAFDGQNPVDRADPSVVEQELKDLRTDLQQPEKPDAQLIEPQRSGGSALARPILLRSVTIDGATVVPASAYEAATQPFVGRELGGRDLRALASAVANVARRAGYGLATAWIPEQTVTGGQLRVVVEEGRIDQVEASGAAADIVEGLLAPLVDGAPVSTEELERRLLLAGDVSGVAVGKARLDRRAGRNFLVIRTWRDKVEARILLDNWGTDTIGPIRAQLGYSVNGLFAGDDRLSLSAVGTPLQPEEFGLIRAAYDKGLGRSGTVLTVSGYVARSEPGGILEDRDYKGRSVEATLGLSHPLVRSRAASLWTDIEFNLRDAEQTREDILIRDDRLALLRASGYAFVRIGEGRLRTRLTCTRGLGILDATRPGDTLSSRDEGSAIFSKLDLWTRFDLPLDGGFSVQLQGEAQVASRALLSSEEMGLGGRYFLRGYDYREFSGDKGAAGSAELRFDLPRPARPLQGAQLYVYGDVGSVGNYDGGDGGGTLASAGGGLRVWLRPNVEASFEIGVPLKDGAFGEAREPRLSFVVGTRL